MVCGQVFEIFIPFQDETLKCSQKTGLVLPRSFQNYSSGANVWHSFVVGNIVIISRFSGLVLGLLEFISSLVRQDLQEFCQTIPKSQNSVGFFY